MAFIKLPLPQDTQNTTFMGLVDTTGQQWTVWRGRNVQSVTVNGQSTPIGDLGVVLVSGAGSGSGTEIVGVQDSQDTVAALLGAGSLRTAALNYAFDGSNWRRMQVDASENLKVALGAALPAGANLIGGVNGSQVGGVAVPIPAALGVASLPVLGTPQALYLSQTIPPSGTAPEFQLGSLALAGNSVFDAKSALVVLVNNSNQPIIGGTLQFTDTIGGVAASLLYSLYVPSLGHYLNIAASGGSDISKVPLVQGVMKTCNLGINYNVAPTSGTISCLVVLQGPGGATLKVPKSPAQQVSVSASVGTIVGANPQRASITFYNPGPGTLWLGGDGTTAVNKGIPVLAGQTLTDDTSGDAWYGLVDSGSATICYVEAGSNWAH